MSTMNNRYHHRPQNRGTVFCTRARENGFRILSYIRVVNGTWIWVLWIDYSIHVNTTIYCVDVIVPCLPIVVR